VFAKLDECCCYYYYYYSMNFILSSVIFLEFDLMIDYVDFDFDFDFGYDRLDFD